MKHASFETLQAAREHRAKFGGWIFEPLNGEEFIWFDMSFTPTTIMLHRATHKLDGILR